MQEDENSTDDPDVETGGGETAEMGFTQSVIVDSEATQPIEAQAEAPSAATPQPVLLGAGASQQPVMLGTVNTQPMMQAQPYGQVMMVGPPSGAPKVIGVLTIVWGAIGLLDGISFITMPKTLAFVALTLLKVITSLGLIYSGALIYSYQKRGIQLTWVLLLIGMVISIATVSMMPAMYEEMVANGDMTQEDADFLNQQSTLTQGIGIGISVFCGGICGLFVAVPLMVANNGLDNSSLFSSTKPDNIDGGTLKEYMGENEMAAAGETQEE